MKTPLIIGVSALALLTLSATLFAQTATGSSLITQMKAATHAFTLSGDLNSGATDLESSPLVGKKTGDMLSAGEYNRLLELVGQGGGGGGTAVYDSGWFSAHSNGATYKTGEGGIPAYTLGKKADIIKLYFRANATSPEREVPSFQMSGAESAWSLAWGDIYGPRPVTLDSSYISIQYGTSVGGACYKFGPGFSSPCGFNGSNIYYEDVGQLKIVAYSFGGTGGGGNSGGSSWVDVPLTDTADYDTSCDYRYFIDYSVNDLIDRNWMNDVRGVGFASHISSKYLGSVLSASLFYGIPSVSKSKYGFRDSSNSFTESTNVRITKLQKRC